MTCAFCDDPEFRDGYDLNCPGCCNRIADNVKNFEPTSDFQPLAPVEDEVPGE